MSRGPALNRSRITGAEPAEGDMGQDDRNKKQYEKGAQNNIASKCIMIRMKGLNCVPAATASCRSWSCLPGRLMSGLSRPSHSMSHPVIE